MQADEGSRNIEQKDYLEKIVDLLLMIAINFNFMAAGFVIGTNSRWHIGPYATIALVCIFTAGAVLASLARSEDDEVSESTKQCS